MKPIHALYVLSAFILSACCQRYDSTVSEGYPYGGRSQQVAVKIYTGSILRNPAFTMLEDSLSLHGKLIRDTAECNAYFRQFNPMYSCDIDFGRYSLTVAKAMLEYSDENPELNYRFMVNHTAKTCTLELRGKTRVCTGWGYKSSFIFMKDFILVPKIPAAYGFSVSKIWPAQ